MYGKKDKLLIRPHFYVKDYLKGAASDSEAVERCIADGVKNGEDTMLFSRTVIFDARDWTLDRAILLPSNTAVLIKDCTLRLADGVFDNLFRGDNYEIDPDDPYGYPLSIGEVKNIRIRGEGNATLEGPRTPRRGFHPVLNEEQDMTGDFWGWRTHLISFTHADGVEIGNINIKKTASWAICFDDSRRLYVHDVNFDTHVKNGDGINFRAGCHGCNVERITGSTSDDTVACTSLGTGRIAYPYKNYLYPNEPASYVAERSEESRTVSDVVIRSVNTSGSHHGVILLAANGNKVKNVLIYDIEEAPGEWREATVKIYTGYGSGYSDGDISGVTVRNVKGTFAEHTVKCNTQIKDAVLENITHAVEGRELALDYPDGIEIK